MAKRKSPRRARRKFTDEFKAEVVELVRDGGQSVAEVSRNLDLTESAVRSWLERSQPNEESSISSAESEELKRLRAENKRLRQERDILAKATAFFAKEST